MKIFIKMNSTWHKRVQNVCWEVVSVVNFCFNFNEQFRTCCAVCTCWSTENVFTFMLSNTNIQHRHSCVFWSNVSVSSAYCLANAASFVCTDTAAFGIIKKKNRRTAKPVSFHAGKNGTKHMGNTRQVTVIHQVKIVLRIQVHMLQNKKGTPKELPLPIQKQNMKLQTHVKTSTSRPIKSI